jgi:hypothetical protein
MGQSTRIASFSLLPAHTLLQSQWLGGLTTYVLATAEGMHLAGLELPRGNPAGLRSRTTAGPEDDNSGNHHKTREVAVGPVDPHR